MKEFLLKRLNKIKTYRFRYLDYKLLVLVIGLTILGIKVIGSATTDASKVRNQVIGMLLGLMFIVALTLIDYHFVLKFYWLVYIVMIGLLLVVNFKGHSGGGAQRWIPIGGGFNLQPSELAKIMTILFYAKLIYKFKDKLNTLRSLFIIVVLMAPTLVLIYKQPDLSTTILIAVLFCCILFIGGISYKIVIAAVCVAIPAFVFLLFLILQPEQKILKGYQINRIVAFYNQEEDDKKTDELMEQQENSVIAIGSGGLWGKGLANDDADSVKNGNYLYEPHTDFIFAVIGEDLGFVGTLIVIVVLLLIVYECFNVGIHAPDVAGKIIACSMGSLISFQTFINLAVVTKMIPNTGLTLPFISYGLSSLVSMYIGIGFVLNVSLQHKRLI